MGNRKRITAKILFILSVIIAFGLTVARPARADWGLLNTPPSISKLKGNKTIHLDYVGTCFGAVYCVPKGNVTNIKVSNKRVIDDVYYQKGDKTLMLHANKAGKCTVSYKYQGKNYKAKLTFKKWSNPLAKITIGSKNYSQKYKRASVMYVEWEDVRGKKIAVTPKSGWKLSSIKWCTYSGGQKVGNIKNGSMLPKTTDSPAFVAITLKDKAGNTKEMRIGFPYHYSE